MTETKTDTAFSFPVPCCELVLCTVSCSGLVVTVGDGLLRWLGTSKSLVSSQHRKWHEPWSESNAVSITLISKSQRSVDKGKGQAPPTTKQSVGSKHCFNSVCVGVYSRKIDHTSIKWSLKLGVLQSSSCRQTPSIDGMNHEHRWCRHCCPPYRYCRRCHPSRPSEVVELAVLILWPPQIIFFSLLCK